MLTVLGGGPSLRRRGFIGPWLPALAIVALILSLSSRESLATPDVTGQWTPNSTASSNGYAIHMLLLRGDGQPYHSRILWWSGEGNGVFQGSEWGWRNASSGCNAFPDTTSISPILVPGSGINPFCGGHAPFNRRVLVAGGADAVTMTYGDNMARVLRDAAGIAIKSWYDPGAMTQWRWYPTETVLGGGRVLVTAGARAPHHRFFGGRRNGSIPTGGVQDSVYRFFPAAGGQWDKSVVPASDVNGRPPWREHHTAVEMELDGNIKGHVIFGGDSASIPINDLWFLHRDPNYTGGDYTYRWEKKTNASGTAPSRRSFHTAIGAPAAHTFMFVYGGRDQNGNASDNHVYRYDDYGFGTWTPITPGGSQSPAARFGHTAICDETIQNPNTTRDTLRSMIVYGGIGTDNQTPVDTTVWEMRFTDGNFNSGTWQTMTWVQASNPPASPSARIGHSIVWDGGDRTNTFSGKHGHVGFMFGGQVGATSYSDTLWALWLFNDRTYGWEPKIFGGSPPPLNSGRARHTMVLDPLEGANGARLYLFGGENASALADPVVYVVDPWDPNPTWSKWASLGATLSGQSVTLDRTETLARTPDVFDPAAGPAGQWLRPPLSSTTLLQDTYPPTFVISGGPVTGDRVLALAQNDTSYYVDIASSGSGNAWNPQPGNPLVDCPPI